MSLRHRIARDGLEEKEEKEETEEVVCHEPPRLTDVLDRLTRLVATLDAAMARSKRAVRDALKVKQVSATAGQLIDRPPRSHEHGEDTTHGPAAGAKSHRRRSR